MNAMLQTELETYKRMLATLLPQEGKFALITDSKLLGVYDTYGDALAEGYDKVGLSGFLVKKIAAFEVAASFTRDIACTAPSRPA